MKRCRITVLKRHFDEELAKEYGSKGIGKCPMLKEGQIFYADYAKPEGFCDDKKFPLQPFLCLKTSRV